MVDHRFKQGIFRGLPVRCTKCGGAFRQLTRTYNCPYCRHTRWTRRKVK